MNAFITLSVRDGAADDAIVHLVNTNHIVSFEPAVGGADVVTTRFTIETDSTALEILENIRKAERMAVCHA